MKLLEKSTRNMSLNILFILIIIIQIISGIKHQQMSKLDIQQLLSALTPSTPPPQTTLTHHFIAQQHKHAVPELPLQQQLAIKRESSYRTTQEQADKWIGIVKLNREKESLNFAKVQRDNAAAVNFFPSAPISTLQSQIDQRLKNMQIQSQGAVLQKQSNILERLSKEEAKERLKQARKQRTMIFNEEIKSRRIAKIKSKLYHKIKKRQKVREESKRIEGMDHEQRKEYLQKLTKQRIHERITLRHKSKSKHILDLLRFNKGGKNQVQQSLNEINRIRKEQLEKVNEMFLQNMSQEYDDENDPQNAIGELQKQIDNLQQKQPQKGIDGMKFMKLGREQQLREHKIQAKKIVKMLNEQQEGFDSESQSEMAEQGEQAQLRRRKVGEGFPLEKRYEGRSSSFVDKNIKDYLSINQANQADKTLLEGIDVNRLKQKYNPNRLDTNLSEVITKHHPQLQNQAVLDNFRQFQEQKMGAFEEELPEQKKSVKGWGKWAGPGISEAKIDHGLQVRRKLLKIEEIKRRRRDGELNGVIIRQSYNKNLKDYFVNKLPHNFKTIDQFDYVQQEKIGPEWSTLSQFKTNIKPKVITKAGQVIEHIKMPKKLQKPTK